MTKDQTESAATWFEHHMPPMPGARAMYRTAVEALRAVGRLQAENDAMANELKKDRTCENCLHETDLLKCDDQYFTPCEDCPVDCYCKDCTGACKWEWRGIEVAVMDKQTCETCTHFPPSSCDGKPCSLCDSEDTKLDCYQRKEERNG